MEENINDNDNIDDIIYINNDNIDIELDRIYKLIYNTLDKNNIKYIIYAATSLNYYAIDAELKSAIYCNLCGAMSDQPIITLHENKKYILNIFSSNINILSK